MNQQRHAQQDALDGSLQAVLASGRHAITVEVVPPVGAGAEPLLADLARLKELPFHGFSVATNPVAKPHMSALALGTLLQQRTGKPVTLHCTTRDHNRLSLQSLLWGARALGIESVLVTTGDYVALGVGGQTTSVRDLNVYELVRMARDVGHFTGVALDPGDGSSRLAHEAQRLEKKASAGAQFVVTQPVYDELGVRRIYDATRHLGIPVLLGILPLHTARHARFLDRNVSGIAVPDSVQARMSRAADPQAEGLVLAREVLGIARQFFAGACIMPAFGHYEILADLIA